jgi:hypothetical protein
MNIIQAAPVSRPATIDDLDEVAELLHAVFGVRQTAETLRWKYTGCAGRLVGSAVLISNRRIVGFLGQIPVLVSAAGREVLAAQGADIGILEEHRRLDAFLGLIQTSVHEMQAAGVALAYGIANADAAATLSSLLGTQAVASVPLLVRPLGGRFFARAFDDCVRWTERRHALSSDLQLKRLERFDERFDIFWRRVRDDYPIMIARDAASLNRRYVASPAVTYERICVERAASGEIEGYAILGLSRWGARVRGRIADLVTPRQGDPRVAGALIRAAVHWLRAQRADVADVWMFPHAHMRSALLRHGFLPRRTGQGGFQASAFSPDAGAALRDIHRAGNWFLSMGDSDVA